MRIQLKALRVQVLAAAFSLSVLLSGLGFLLSDVPAHAEPKGDSLSIGCMQMRSRANDLADEYGDVGQNNPGSDRLGEILTELRSIGSAWKAAGCQSAFGNILALEAMPHLHYAPAFNNIPVVPVSRFKR